MNEDIKETSSDMQESKSQPMNSPTPQKPKSKRSVLIAIIAVVVVVIVVVIAVTTWLPSTPSTSTKTPTETHFGFISVNTADNITGTTLTQIPVLATNSSPSGVIKAQAMNYLMNQSTSSDSITIIVQQFSNSTGATNFYNNEFNTSKIATPTYGSYKAFDYFYVSVSLSSYYEALAVGHAGQFVFVIADVNIPISSLNTLVQDQINAMT